MDQPVNRNRVDGMFDATGVCFGLLRVELKGGDEEFAEGVVPAHDILRNTASVWGEGDMAVRTVIDKAPAGQRLEGPGYRSALNAHLICNLFGANHSVRFFQMEDHLEIIFQAGRKPLDKLGNRLLSPGFAWLFHVTVPTPQTTQLLPATSSAENKNTPLAASSSRQEAKLAPATRQPGTIPSSISTWAFFRKEDHPYRMMAAQRQQHGTICTIRILFLGTDCPSMFFLDCECFDNS